MELSTTRDAGNALTTKTPGAPAQASNYGDLFAALIKQRMAQQAAAPVAASAPVNSAAERGSSAGIPEQYGSSMSYRDTSGGSSQGAAPIKPKQISRTVPDPFASPWHTFQYGAGSVAPSREERYIDGVGWEFADVRPQGGSGGIQGGGALSSLHATLEPADPIQAQYGAIGGGQGVASGGSEQYRGSPQTAQAAQAAYRAGAPQPVAQPAPVAQPKKKSGTQFYDETRLPVQPPRGWS